MHYFSSLTLNPEGNAGPLCGAPVSTHDQWAIKSKYWTTFLGPNPNRCGACVVQKARMGLP